MRRSRRRTSQILFWIFSLFVVLSMALGLAVSVVPRPRQPTPTPTSFQFAVCGDNDGSSPIYEQILKRAAEDGSLFLIHTGNLVPDGSEAEFQKFAQLMANFSPLFYPVPGDNDYYQGTLDNFLRYSGAPDAHYSFDYGSVHFTLANSDLGDMTAEELAWLRADLAASTQPVKMVFLHYPPFDPSGGTDIMHSGNEEFMALMEEQRVDYVFAGHIRAYEAEERNGVHYIITGGAGAPLDRGPEEGGFYHYVRVKVQGTEVTVEVVPIEEAR